MIMPESRWRSRSWSAVSAWRTLNGLADFAIVRSYLSTAAKWGISKLNALRHLFTTGLWLPPAVAPP
jgi:transposase